MAVVALNGVGTDVAVRTVDRKLEMIWPAVVVSKSLKMSAGDWIDGRNCYCCCCDCGRTCGACRLSLFELVLKRSVRL